MSNSENEVNNALQEYLEAFAAEKKFQEKYISEGPVEPGKLIELKEPLPESALKDWQKAGSRVTKAREKWLRALASYSN